ncbi:hypothetical protein SAMN02746095_03708 [Acidocella aminolytica 101 = DSM 11237]|uniref:Uncharacterized protein n=2 Tax=Acidocella TaxID=50709 RepID=A0A0D6PIC0_9PROT|nr:hypothetical protein Aam_098_017 [Acidocella aminolytica 101 = DSM 11237]SHF56291.1 hypothetical protein SAMN02746095_03708 [Acidocella aminolytica 101 = DSM 11237]
MPACMESIRKPYTSDVSDDEGSLVVSYLTLVREDASQRQHSLRQLFKGLSGRYPAIATRYEKRATNYLAVVKLASI